MTTPSKPIGSGHDMRKKRSESQSSNSSSFSDKDSVKSSEKNIQIGGCTCDHKATNTNLVSGDEENCIDSFLKDIEHDEMEMMQEVAKPIVDDQKLNDDAKPAKQMKMGLKEGGRSREHSSPMRGVRLKADVESSSKLPKPTVLNHAWKANAETLPEKNFETKKRTQASNSLKFQVQLFIRLFFITPSQIDLMILKTKYGKIRGSDRVVLTHTHTSIC